MPPPETTARRPGRREKPTIRTVRDDDRPAVRALCAATAQAMPGPVRADPALAPMLYLDAYLDLEPAYAFAAFAGDGSLAGYAVGTPDVRSFRVRQRRWTIRRLPAFGVHHVRATLGGRVDGFRGHLARARWLRGVLFPQGDAGPPDVDLDRYPAHGHLQVATAHRDGRAGLALFKKLQSAFKSAGVPGQHVDAFGAEEDDGYFRMVSALGFALVRDEPVPTPAGQPARRRRVLVRAYR